MAVGDWTALPPEDLASALRARHISPLCGPCWLQRHTWPWGVGSRKGRWLGTAAVLPGPLHIWKRFCILLPAKIPPGLIGELGGSGLPRPAHTSVLPLCATTPTPWPILAAQCEVSLALGWQLLHLPSPYHLGASWGPDLPYDSLWAPSPLPPEEPLLFCSGGQASE